MGSSSALHHNEYKTHSVMKLPSIALVGNAPQDKCDLLNNMLREDDLTDLCSITLYGADGQPEQEALHDALEDQKKGIIQGIVCLPMQVSPKKAVAHATGIDNTEISLFKVNGKSRMMSLKKLTPEDIKKTVNTTANILKRDLSIQNPRIAVLAYNDTISTDENSEEMSVIAPTISELVKEGIQAFGPLDGKSFYDGNDYMSYDAVLETREGQVTEIFNALTDEGAVTILAGANTPPVTSAEAEDILSAMYIVTDIIRNRENYDKPFANPLQKLYHERKEGNDKTRFTVKKKGFNPAEHRRENVTYITKEDQ